MRTRFPPSPTGFLHVGGLRTALYDYLLSKQTNDRFILRIEDTDQERQVDGAVEDFLVGLAWAGVHPDEGVMLQDGRIIQAGERGPYIQSERTAIYREHADKLLAKGAAYHCFCTKERLEQMRKDQEARKQPPMYDRHCLKMDTKDVETKLKAGEPHVLRLKVPHERNIEVDDDIRGHLTFQGHTIDDQVLLKSDGFPTYHLANVVDDHLMDIDLVLRGEEWLSSLPKHILLYEAFEWMPPRFAHVPLLLSKDRQKLSKRDGAVSVREYISQGYLPEAMVNFLALLGWNPGTTQEVFSMQELIDQFSLDRVQKGGAIFDLQKLQWLQGQWMRKMSKKDFEARVLAVIAEHFPEAKQDAHFAHKADLIHERITFFKEAPDMLGFFYKDPVVTTDLVANAKQKVEVAMLPEIFATLEKILNGIDTWTAEAILAAVKEEVAKGTWKLGQLLWPLRASLTGQPYSPGAVEVAAVLGKEKTMERLEKAKRLT